MSGFSNDRIRTSIDSLVEGTRRKQRTQQSRQLLSCTKCRERKVKCDRTKPCSACCARGAPKECHFVAEGGDYAPIQQSYELRKLRAENMRLKERLRASKIPIEDDDSDAAASPESQSGERPNNQSQKRRAARQKRFQGAEWTDSIYFGSPGLANVITDFAAANLSAMSAQSLAHLMPHGPDVYTPKTPPSYPFPTLFHATPDQCIPQLLKILPSDKQLLEYLDAFEKRITVCSLPHVSIEITKSEVERFLSQRRKNAAMCPDMLALLFAAMALGALHSVWDKGGGKWNAQIMDEELQKGNVYIAASMQALRMASYLHKPTILAIETLIMMGPYLTHSGRFVEAWTLFGTTIRMAQSIGLHRNPKYLDPAPPTQRECAVRQTLWWWMLHMDEQYSMTLGRPLGISGIGDCPPPHELTTDPHMLRFGDFVNHFTLLARQILSSDRLTDARIDEFTDLLKSLLDTMPEMLQFDESWVRKETEIPEWPLSAMAAVYYCKTHIYLILLNRQRSDKNTVHSQTPNCKVSSSPFRSVNQTPSSHPSPTMSTTASLRGRSLVLSSSEDILTAFLFFYHRAPAALISWTISQQAFNSCMLLLLDALEIGKMTPGIWKVEQAYAVFRELQDKGVHRFASLAVERISWGLQELQQIMSPPTEGSTTQGDRRGSDPDMQRATKNQASRGSEALPDTVMSNKSMLLLEDPGLQSFVPETFEAFSWIMPGTNESNETSCLKQDLGELKSEGSNNSHEGTWGLDTEPMSARCTAIRQGPSCQPRVSLAPSSHQQPDDTKASVASRQRPGPPPHSHHKSPWETAEARQLHCHSRKTLNMPPTQARHQSCPSIAQVSVPSIPRHAYSCPTEPRRPSADHSADPSLRKTQVVSVSAPGQQHFLNNAMPPSSLNQASWPTHLSSAPSAPDPVTIPTTQGYLQDQQRYQYDFASHYSNTTRNNGVTVPVSSAEMDVDSWGRWSKSHGVE